MGVVCLVKPRHRAVATVNRNFDCLRLEESVKWKERGKKGFVPSSVSWCVCVHLHSLEMMDNRVAKKKRWRFSSPEDMWASESQGRQKVHSSRHHGGQASADL